MTEPELQAKLAERFGAKANVSVTQPRRVWTGVAKPDLKTLIKWLKDDLGFYHLSTITGLDNGENLEVLYHLTDGNILLTVRMAVAKADAHIPTITDAIPGAILYERELQDMFGFKVDGIPDPRRYVLPEDWPDGVYPLRKDFKVASDGK